MIYSRIITFILGLVLIITTSFKEDISKDYSKLKAILVVGYQEDGTKEAMKSIDELADFFTKKGIKVEKFYDSKADWEKIKTAAKGANFFVYRGHGTSLGDNGDPGGLCIAQRISSKTIEQDLKLAPNALIIFKSVCYGAGSSAGDDGDIGIIEATKRVTSYAKPFFKTGAAAYYANNQEAGCLHFLNDFFDGETISKCFENSSTTWNQVEINKKWSIDATKNIGIASSDWGGTATRTTYTNGVKKVEEIPNSKNYSIAYVANPEYTIKDLLNESTK